MCLTISSNSVHPTTSHMMPDWPRFNEISAADGRSFSMQEREQLDRIISYLAVEHPTLYPAKMRRIHPQCGNLCCSRLAKIFGELILNPLTVLKDTIFCCCVSVSDPEPDAQTWLPKKLFDELNQNRRDTNRNTLFLLGVAPALTIGSPYIPAVASVSTVIGIGINLLLLFSAGVQTFLLVDYGSGELQTQVVSKLGFEQLSIYLREKWEGATLEEKREWAQQIIQMQKNIPFLESGMINRGIRPEFVDSILIPFRRALGRICYEIEHIVP